MKKFSGILLFPMSLVFLEIATYLANDMYIPGLPSLAKDFKVSQDIAQYTLLVWFLGSASMQLITGPLSDRYGRKVILLIGGFLFFLTSLVCALTQDMFTLLVARFIQGSTICAVVVAGYSAIHELFDTKRAIKIISVMGSVTILAPALGPLFGAIIIEYTNWRVVFWILTVWGLIASLMLLKVMPDTNKHQRVHINIKETVMDYIKISCRKAFLKHMLPYCLLFMAFIGWIVESPFIIIETLSKSKIEYGIIQFMIFGSFLIGAQATRFLIERISGHQTILVGLSIVTLGTVAMFTMSFMYEEHLYHVMVGMMVISLGAAIAFGPMNRAAIDACEEPMGRRNAIFSTYMSVFGVLATFVVTLFNDKTLPNLVAIMSVTFLMAALIYGLSTDGIRLLTKSQKAFRSRG